MLFRTRCTEVRTEGVPCPRARSRAAAVRVVVRARSNRWRARRLSREGSRAGVEGSLGRSADVAALETGAVIKADPGQVDDFLSPQARDPVDLFRPRLRTRARTAGGQLADPAVRPQVGTADAGRGQPNDPIRWPQRVPNLDRGSYSRHGVRGSKGPAVGALGQVTRPPGHAFLRSSRVDSSSDDMDQWPAPCRRVQPGSARRHGKPVAMVLEEYDGAVRVTPAAICPITRPDTGARS